MSAFVHHSGAGTTAEGLRAGMPTVIVPHRVDQPFWGSRIADLGVGPQPISRNKLSLEKLAAAVPQATTDSRARCCAIELGVRIHAQDGIDMALGKIEDYLGKK